MNKLRPVLLCCSFLLLALSTRLHAQTADDIVNKFMDALGGKAKLEAIRSIYTEGTAVLGNGTEINIKSWKVMNKLYRSEISFGMGNVIIIVTPTKGWSSNPRTGGEFKELPAEAVKNMQPEMDPVAPLVDYAAKGGKVELQGKEAVNGKDCYKLKLTASGGQEITYYIDAQTYYIDRVIHKGNNMGGGNGKAPQDMTMDMADYQKTKDGFAYPTSITTSGFGAKLNVEKIDINPNMDVDKLEEPK